MEYEGKVYRPWPEAHSLLIQTTIGCSHNKCTFCDMFRDKKFRIRKLEDVFADIKEFRQMYHHVESIFLIDGNVMVLKTERLLQIVNKITETFPECKRIALYSGFNDMRRKSVEELKQLREAGVKMVYVGLESGDPVVLERVNKGMTVEEAKEGMANAKAAGIDVLVSFIFGLGGKERSHEHIVRTTALVNELEPEQIAPMAMTIQPGTILAQRVASGEFVQATPLQMLEEEKYLLENLGDFDCIYWGDHGNNIVPMRGWMPEHRPLFLAEVEKNIANNPITQEEVHLAMPW